MKEVNMYGVINETKTIKLNGNESYLSVDENIFFKALSELRNVELNRYPDSEGLELRKMYAKYADVDARNIIMGNGSDEMLSLVISSLISKGKKVLTLNPDFSMYDFYVSLSEGELIKYNTNKDGSFNVDEFINSGLSNDVDLIMISNPNNPTGYAINKNDIKKILTSFRDKKVLIDEAYYEFYGETAVDLIREFDNLLVTRTLSKAWGLAALRVGFLIGNKTLISNLSKYKVPYNVNSLSQAIALKMLSRPQKVIDSSQKIIVQRDKFYKELKELENESSLEIKFYESKGNYIFGRTPYKEALLKAMYNKGISIRSFEDDSFRITVGSSLENERVLEGIKKSFVY